MTIKYIVIILKRSNETRKYLKLIDSYILLKSGKKFTGSFKIEIIFWTIFKFSVVWTFSLSFLLSLMKIGESSCFHQLPYSSDEVVVKGFLKEFFLIQKIVICEFTIIKLIVRKKRLFSSLIWCCSKNVFVFE